MIDRDAPISHNGNVYLHWLKMNNNQTIKPYYGPHPPPNSGSHRYYICLINFININQA